MTESKTVEYKTLFWHITGLSKNKAEQYQTGDKILSNIFTIVRNGKVFKLYIQMYPNGLKPKSKGHVELYLHLQKTILNNFHTAQQIGISCEKKDYVGIETMASKKMWEDRSCWSQPEWIDHATLFNPENEYFIDGKLTIFCNVKISMEQETTEAVKAVKFDKSIEFFSKIFFMKEHKDCELHTSDGKVLKCNKSILAARSPVFEAMFATGMEEADKGVVKIKDFDSVSMNQLLRFAYCLEVEELDDIASDLIYAADKYQIKELKEICCNSLIANLKQDNVFDSLSIAEKISDCKNLFDDCLKIIAMNYKVLSKTAEWKELQQPTLLKIIDYTMLNFKSSDNLHHSTNIE